MTMAAAVRPGAPLRLGKAGNAYAPGRSPSGGEGRRIRPGKALVWLFGLAVCAAFVAVVSVALLVGFRWLTTNSYFALREIAVSGNQRLDVEEIISLADVALGANTLEIKIADVEAKVASSPWAGTVAVRRVLPAGLAISVSERSPHWWVRTPRGLFYAEADGAVIAPVSSRKFMPLPVLDIDPEAGGLPAELQEMIREFDALELPVRSGGAAWVRVLPQRLELYFDDRGLTVAATTRDWKRNMDRLALVWADLVRRGQDRAAREIRIFGGKVWVRT